MGDVGLGLILLDGVDILVIKQTDCLAITLESIEYIDFLRVVYTDHIMINISPFIKSILNLLINTLIKLILAIHIL